jgi:hypothetical protein
MLVTKFFEQNGRPLLHEVLPMFDKLDDAFTEMVKDFTMNSVVRYLVSCGFSLLDKYYGKTDEGVLYRAALCECQIESHSIYLSLPFFQFSIQILRITLSVEIGCRIGLIRQLRSSVTYGSSIIGQQMSLMHLHPLWYCLNQRGRRRNGKKW